MHKTLAALGVAAVLAGCAAPGGPPASTGSGGVQYRQPEAAPESRFSRTVDKPREAAWKALAAGVEKSPFTLQSANREGGAMTLMYSGDPERYVDCGRVVSQVKQSGAKREYDFPASRAHQRYEIAGKKGVYVVERKMALDAKVQLVLDEAGAHRSRARAKGYYTLTRTLSVRKTGAAGGDTTTDAVRFESDTSGVFQMRGARCAAPPANWRRMPWV